MRRPLLWLSGLVVLASAAYAGYWRHVAQQLNDGLAPWAAQQRDAGYALAWRSVEIAGFPLVIRLRLTGVTLQASRPIPYAARSDELTASAPPFDFRTWHVTAPSGVHFDAPTLIAGIDAAALDGSIGRGGDATVIAATVRELSGRGFALGFGADRFEFRLSLPARAAQGHRDAALSLEASLKDASLAAAPAGMPRRIDSLALTATIKGIWPPGPLVPALQAWRDDGGTLELDAARLVWGATTVELDGTLALDAGLQPEGALTARVTGADQVVDAAVASGAMAQRYADFAKSVLRAIAAKDENGASALRVPLTLQDRRLYIGPAAVAALPHIDWR